MSNSPDQEFVASPAESVSRTRTSKGKSRSGCTSCKQRRVKCDEVRPGCSGCLKRSSQCVYKVPVEPQWKQNINTFVAASQAKSTKKPSSNLIITNFNLPTTSSSSTSYPALPSYYLSLIPTENRQLFGIEDGFLLEHFKFKSSFGLIGDQKLWASDMIQLGFQNDFLLHAILAVAARHFQMTCHDQAIELPFNFKQIQVRHMQQSISAFHCALERAKQSRTDAVLATSLLLCFYACSIHDFKLSTLIPCEDTSFIFLLGTRSLVIDKSRIPYDSVVKPFIQRPKWLSLFLPRISPILGPGGRLINLINRLPVTPSLLENKEMYIERIESLTVYLSTSAANTPDQIAVESLSLCFLRWQAACPPKFVSLIKTHDPIALIILAHYYAAAGYVLTRSDNLWWWWQEKPKYMVDTIAEFLLPAWAEWLEWPISQIGRV